MRNVFSFFSRKSVKVVDAMNPNPKTISSDSTLLEASKKMLDEDVGSLLVVEGDVLKGIITKVDIVNHVVVKGKGTNLKVSDIMTKRYLSISPNKPIDQAANLMVSYGVRRLPVIEKGKIKGLITQTDLLRIQPAIIDLLVEKFAQDKEVSDIRSLKGVKGVCDICGELNYLREHSEGMVCDNCAEALQ